MERMPSFEQVPEEKKAEPKKEKSGFSKFTEKIKTGTALAAAIAGIGMSEMSEAQGADRLQANRTTERVIHSGRQGLDKAIQTPLGEIRYTNPLKALTADVGYRPRVVKNTTAFSASISGYDSQVGIRAKATHSSRVVNQGSQSRKIRHK
ncbi:MAG: hypothetical protein Q7R64_04020 [bacterium]|nr:hypothetical protein [bacterium]